MTNEPWVDRHRPTEISEIQGNNSDLDAIKTWADDWDPGDSPILLVGPPGTGKTSTAEAVANRLGVQTVEVNASSARSTADLQSMADQIQTTGEGGRRLILIDEVDSWHHGPDKTVLYDALAAPGNPVIMTANDAYEVADGIEAAAKQFEFSLSKASRRAKLKDIRDAEDVDLSDQALEALADRPDLRSAINDLQLHAMGGATVGSDDREWEDSEWDVLDRVLSGTPDIGSLSPPDALMWLDECTSAEYRGLELAMAYEAMALADVQLRTARERSYRYWKYARALLEEVALIRQTEPYYDDEISYKAKSFPEWFRHSAPSAQAETATATLYRQLKGGDGFAFAGDYALFREALLPLLRGLDVEEKYELALTHDLTGDELEELGADAAKYEAWREGEAPEAGEWTGKVEAGSNW